MAAERRWTGVFSRRELNPLPDPHPASALAVVDGIAFCSSVLPWRSCGNDPWGEGTHASRTQRAVEAVLGALPGGPLVWGGDFNHALTGREYAGSKEGRQSILVGLESRNLSAPTTTRPHQIDPLLSIDHLAVPRSWTVTGAERISAATEAGRLSDHDAYVVEADAATVLR